MNKGTLPAREKLDPERWRRLKDILADALELETPAARTALVESRSAEDATLRLEAISLVRGAEALLQEPTDALEDCAERATEHLWQDEPPPAGGLMGAYAVTRELGRGGMGAVYLAARADGQFEREVAIKVLKRGTDTEEVLRRFAGERHILARLDHPNIAHLLDAGTTADGLPYVVMEYVAGVPVTRYLREHNLSLAERLGIFLKICAAVETAHQHHVVHRDLKPSNILVTKDSEPKLLDFGIAKLLGPDQDCVDLTAAGEERLTPNCASPEQTDGRPITEASDVYALGALLYEMLTGQKPHKFSSTHPSREEIIRVICEEEPEWPSAAVEETWVARQLRGDLDAMILRALRKEPAQRYPTVSELVADVRRHLAHEPVLARRGSAGYRARSFVVRHRRGLRLAGAAALIFAVGALATWGYWRSGARWAGADDRLPKSIAVLPFDSLGDKSAPSYFVEGIQDNILTDLAKVGDLKVISRSAVENYRGKSRDVRALGRALGAVHVLEGSVQISGARMRVNAQLIDTRTDTQVWAEQYDRKLEDIFALQSELAQNIAAQLRATLSARERAAIWKRPTEDLQAYDLYLRARASFNKTGLADATPVWDEELEQLREAVARDPKFALAYCLQSEVYVFKYRWGAEHAPQDLAAGKEAAETALRLQPELEEARLALARYYYHGLSDYRRALEELARIPSEEHTAEFYTLASLAERRLGLWRDSLREGEKAMELDPNNPAFINNYLQSSAGLRRFAESERVAEAALLRLPPEEQDPTRLLKFEALLDRGDLPAAEIALESLTIKNGMDYELGRLWLDFLKHDYSKALALAERASPESRNNLTFWLIAGAVARSGHEVEIARRDFAQAREMAQRRLQRRPNDPGLLSALAVAETGLGRGEEGRRLAQRAFDLAPPGADALVSPACGAMLAQVLTWNGEREAAFSLLARLVKMPFGPNYGELRDSPYWDALRSDPRFEQLLVESLRPQSL